MNNIFDRSLERDRPWDQRLQYLLAATVAINLVPHAMSVPVWATVLSCAAILYKFAYLQRGYPLPRRIALSGAAVVATGATYFAFGTLLGVEAASCLLVLLASLKILETNRYRDAMLVIFTSYFLLMAHLLVSQTLISTFFMACDILLITGLMFHIHRRDRRRSARSFRPAMRMLALTLPVWMLFFFLFPRFTAAVWDLKGSGTGTGFSDDLNPGAIERLAESDETAFRVLFKGAKPPAPSNLYWRGEVLHEGDGLRWRRGVEARAGAPLPLGTPSPLSTGYEVYLEPGFQKWLFVLDYVTSFQAGDYLLRTGIHPTKAFSYRTNQDLQTRVTYEAKAGFDSPTVALTAAENFVLLQVPPDTTPRLKELTDRISSEETVSGPARAAALARRTVSYFTENGFRYSIRPGALKAQTGSLLLDEFMFEKKRGFCEHYAAAFATMMRMMKVPARVVIGFQGGRYNDIGGYFLVRQLDAHAWAEIWVADANTDHVSKKASEAHSTGHWLRFDPTEEVAPLRLSLGGEFNRLDAQTLGSMTSEELQSKVDGRFLRAWYRVSLAWDALQMRWNAFLIDYDLSAQLELLGRLGFKNVSVVLLLITLGAALFVIGAVIVLVLRRKAKHVDPIALAWQAFCKRLAGRGVVKRDSEGPLEFSTRAAQAFPMKRAEIHAIANQYIQLRYGTETTASKDEQRRQNEFRAQVRRFSLPAFKSDSSRDASS